MSSYLKNIKVLVVDDNPFMRTIVRRVLSQFGAEEVREAKDGVDAMDALTMGDYKPDIIITDWMMGTLDGLELTRWLRTGEDTPDPFIPVIMMSAHSERGRVTEARDAGVNEFLVKPLSAKSIMQRIQTVIEHPRAFVRTDYYFGPDRRRNDKPFLGQERRNDYDLKTEEQLAEEQRVGISSHMPGTDTAT